MFSRELKLIMQQGTARRQSKKQLSNNSCLEMGIVYLPFIDLFYHSLDKSDNILGCVIAKHTYTKWEFVKLLL